MAHEHVRYAPTIGFHGALKRDVEAYFAASRRRPRDAPWMYLKTVVLLGWFAGTYVLLFALPTSWWLALLLVVSLALAAAGIGFNVQHDASHGAYSNRKRVNSGLALTLDMLGASSYVWRWKHNVFHHSYTNVVGADDDIDVGPLARLAPAQRRLWFHRFQYLYMWLLYGFLTVKWVLIDDYWALITGRISRQRFPRPGGGQLAVLFLGKTLFYVWAFVLPALLFPLWAVLLYWLIFSMVTGTVIAVVFQLAHCVEEADFPLPDAESQRLPQEWAVHQVRSTVDFSRRNRALTWYLGGLNYQIEHHLFPRISHVHYPALAPIVERVCAQYGVTYRAHSGVLDAIASHGRWLRRMGQPVAA